MVVILKEKKSENWYLQLIFVKKNNLTNFHQKDSRDYQYLGPKIRHVVASYGPKINIFASQDSIKKLFRNWVQNWSRLVFFQVKSFEFK